MKSSTYGRDKTVNICPDFWIHSVLEGFFLKVHCFALCLVTYEKAVHVKKYQAARFWGRRDGR